jgi:hypothetical protein
MDIKFKIYCDGCGGQLKVKQVTGSSAYEHSVVYVENCERCQLISYCKGVAEADKVKRYLKESEEFFASHQALLEVPKVHIEKVDGVWVISETESKNR